MLRCSSGSSTGPQGVDDLGFGDGHRLAGLLELADRLGRISTTAIGRIPAWPRRPTQPDASSPSAVTAITSAFGDPTRREIYLFAHEHDDGVTAAEVAERFELHPNVARHHLDKLAAGGYLEVAVARAARRRRRPAVEALPGHGTGHRPRAAAAPRRPAGHAARPGARPAAARPGRGAWPRRSASSTAAAMAGVDVARLRRAPLVPGRAARGGRRAHRPRVRRPRRAARRRAAHRHRALPVRRRRHRAPGDLRGRPRHGQGHARPALRRRPHRRDRARRCRSGDDALRHRRPRADRPRCSSVARSLPRPRVDLAAAARGRRARWSPWLDVTAATRAASTPRA